MIANFSDISVPSLGFFVLGLALVLLAWSRYRENFAPALLAASLIMVASWLSPMDAVVLAGFIFPPYLAVHVLWGRQEKAPSVFIGVVVVWEVLLFIVLRRYEWVGWIDWLDHPVSIIGLSYMLFRIIHLVVEAPSLGAYRISLAAYLSCVLAFWTLISGPIQRYDDFVRGLSSVGRPEPDELLSSSHRMVNGLIKAFLIAPVFLKASDIGLVTRDDADVIDFAVVFYAYPIYLYLNFSGYTDVVIALTRLCGVNTLPENFNRPYLARNIQDFWKRWHMSFGVWITSYIFTPLTKWLLTRGDIKHHGPLTALSVMVTFFIVGAWHGATTNFLVFGLLHGAAVMAAALYGLGLKKALGKTGRNAFEAKPWVRGLAVVLCFHYVCATLALIPNQISDIVGALGKFLA